jgi:hypothetical protein
VSDALERACYNITFASPWRPENIDLLAVYDEDENLLWIDEPFYEIVQKKNEFRGMERREFLKRFGATSAALVYGMQPSVAQAIIPFAFIKKQKPPSGEQIYNSPGTYTWTAPLGFSSMSVVCIGGGGSGGYHNATCTATSGGNSSFTSICIATGGSGGSNISSAGGNGSGGAGGSWAAGDAGFSGGSGGSAASNIAGGGGGAAGYSGNGGNGGNGGANGQNGTGGGAGGGGSGGHGGAGGGVGLYGLGSNGVGGATMGTNAAEGGRGGSGGTNGSTGSSLYPGGSYGGAIGGVANYPGAGGGGGGGLAYKNNYTVTPGATFTVVVGEGGYASPTCSFGGYRACGGAVRIIWGVGRSFPNNAS